ncbi:hypothetical protein P7C73_g420, partial [Tremellales sp. Uapishka_1]
MPSQPALHKPKSKLRLRLGLTPKQKPLPPSLPLIASLNISSSSNLASPVEYYYPNTVSSLDASTNTVSSRGDSQGAFDLSYRTESPASVAPTHYAFISPSPQRNQDLKRHLSPPPQPQSEEDTLHPAISQTLAQHDDIFSLTDQQLSNRFTFIKEIGYGNWGSVWLCRPKHLRSSQLSVEDVAAGKLGRASVSLGGGGAGGKVAVKLVHREKSPTTAARVRALWGEMKIIRQLKHEPHPSIIQFEAFVITPSYALVIMPLLAKLIPVVLPPARATPYFRQLASAVGYLHERGITHNDIKPANVLLSHNDIPVLVDFGFAQKWEVGVRGSFLSSISWGTPEYLDPQRAQGMPHDERASDVWSLGITMFEILIGRTPFEEDDQVEFATPEELIIYHERTRRGEWIGDWTMPDDLQYLLRSMICPDPAYRISAMQAYHHPALQLPAQSEVITPHFVRQAASFDIEEPVPVVVRQHVEKNGEKKKRKPRKKEEQPRASTPTALGESIKQHTSVGKPKAHKREAGVKGAEHIEELPSPTKTKLVIKKSRDDLHEVENKNEEEDPTPTKVIKPAQPLRIKELAGESMMQPMLRTPLMDLSIAAEKRKTIQPRTSQSALSSLANSRPSSSTSRPPSSTKDQRISTISTTSTQPQTKEEAVLKAMKSLEGMKKHRERDFVSSIKRPAPPAPEVDLDRPKSLDSEQEGRKKDLQRRSLGIGKLTEVDEEPEPSRRDTVPADAMVDLRHSDVLVSTIQATPMSPPQGMPSILGRDASTDQPLVHVEITVNTASPMTGAHKVAFPVSEVDPAIALQREQIMQTDHGALTRFRATSGDLIPSRANSISTRRRKVSAPATQTPEAGPREDATAIDSRLDRIAQWVKNVERKTRSLPACASTDSTPVIVEQARQALAEGREPPVPLLPLPADVSAKISAGTPPTPPPQHRFGVSPERAIPPHLRTSSVQVEPATPPKWMTYAEAEERIREANQWIQDHSPVKQQQQHEQHRHQNRKERPTVSHMMKLFSGDDKPSSRSNTPEPSHTVQLKNPQLRGTPSTPALRSSTTRRVPARKSESNLRNFNTLPTISSPALMKVGVYESLLETRPGVVRQGEGWSSLGVPLPRSMGKQSSMASLREKARAFLGDRERHIVDLKAEAEEKRRSGLLRPATPSTNSMLNMGKNGAEQRKMKGFMKTLKGVVGFGRKTEDRSKGRARRILSVLIVETASQSTQAVAIVSPFTTPFSRTASLDMPVIPVFIPLNEQAGSTSHTNTGHAWLPHLRSPAERMPTPHAVKPAPSESEYRRILVHVLNATLLRPAKKVYPYGQPANLKDRKPVHPVQAKMNDQSRSPAMPNMEKILLLKRKDEHLQYHQKMRNATGASPYYGKAESDRTTRK